MRFWQNPGQNNANSSQNGKKKHDGKPAVNAGIDDEGREHGGCRPKGFDEANCHYSYLVRVELVEVYCVEIEGVADHQFYEKEEDQHYSSIRGLLGILVPHKNEDNRTGHDNSKRYDSHPSPLESVYGKNSYDPHQKLSGLDRGSIDEDVEVELCEHEGGGEILQVEDDVDEDENYCHHAKGFEFEQV